MTIEVTKELKTLLGAEVSIGKIDLGVLNRIIIENLLLDDQSGNEMLRVARLSARLELLPLLQGRISIGSVQLFGFNINLNRETPEAIPNYQFLLDAFASNDTIKKESNIDLRINSILIRRGKLSYDVLSEDETIGRFNPNHINVQNIIANISLKAFNKDSLNAHIKRLSFDEKSGFELNKLSLKVLANNDHLLFENFSVNLPSSSINMDTIQLRYNGFEAFSNMTDSIHFKGKTLSSHIALKDIAAFSPAFAGFKDRIYLGMEFDGSLNQLNCPRLEISAGEDLFLLGNVSFQDFSRGSDAYVFGNLSRLYISKQGMNMLVRNLSNQSKTPDILRRIGDISFHGEISGYFNDLVTYGVFKTNLGTVNADVMLSSDTEKKMLSSSGSVKTMNFNLGELTGQNKLGKITFNLNITSTQYYNSHPRVKVKGLVSSIEYNKYDYKNIQLDGEYKQGGFDGKIALDDKNGAVVINGNFNTAANPPIFDFKAEFKDIKPHNLNLTSDYKDAEFTVNIHANFEGSSIDDMNGEINIDSLFFISPDKYYFLDNLNMKATRVNGHNRLVLDSEFIKGEVLGNYSYRTIPASILKTIERYIPSLLTMNKELEEPNNNFTFNIRILDTSILSEVFNIPLTIYTPSTISGYFNDIARTLRIEGYFPAFSYDNNSFESGMILCQNPSEKFECDVRVSSLGKSVFNVSLNAKAQNDKLQTTINWGNNMEVTHSGTFSALTNFFKTEGKNPILQANIDIQPTEIILNDSIWNIHSSHIAIDSGRVYVDDFLLKHKDQFVRIDGKLTNEVEDTVKVELNDIDVGYVFDIVRLRSVDFTGIATGKLWVNQALKSPEMNTDLYVKSLAFNGGVIGDAHILGKWDKVEEGVFLNADIQEADIAQTNVNGYIFIGKKGLDLHIDADGTNLDFLKYYLEDIVSNVSGRAFGKVRLFGEFSALNLDGSALADASLKVNILNATYSLKDTIRLKPEGLDFDYITIADQEDHRGVINGRIRYQNFKNINYRITASVNNMLLYDVNESLDYPFYGTVYGTGDVLLNGNPEQLSVDVNVNTNRNTNFTYLFASTSSAASNQFITFVDKTPRRNVYDIRLNENSFTRDDDSPLDIRLNLQVDVTQDAAMKIIMDPTSGDYISGKGAGNIRVDFYNKGDVKFFGNYAIEQGIYKFSLQEVIRKDFIIKSGSSIEFNGDPENSNLDIQAVHTVNSVSLSDLGLGESITQNNVRVNCLMNIAGNLTNPELKFDIELPYADEKDKEIVRSAISTEEEMTLQILYLLGIGKFYTYDYANNSQSSNTMSSALSSTLSGQLNNMFSQIIDNSNWNIGTSFSTGEKGWTDLEMEGILSGQLLNNRLLINGNFGYRENSMSTNSVNFVGDFDIEWLLTRSGEIRLKAYNQTNDSRYITRKTLTTQGVGVVYKKDFNNWRDIFSIRRKKKEEDTTAVKDTIVIDTIAVPESQKKRERTN